MHLVCSHLFPWPLRLFFFVAIAIQLLLSSSPFKSRHVKEPAATHSARASPFLAGPPAVGPLWQRRRATIYSGPCGGAHPPNLPQTAWDKAVGPPRVRNCKSAHQKARFGRLLRSVTRHACLTLADTEA